MKSSFVSGINQGANLSAIRQKSDVINKTVEFNGDIILNGVENPNSLAKAIKMQLPNALMQELYKK